MTTQGIVDKILSRDAPAKAATLLGYVDIDKRLVDYVVDLNNLKRALYGG